MAKSCRSVIAVVVALVVISACGVSVRVNGSPTGHPSLARLQQLNAGIEDLPSDWKLLATRALTTRDLTPPDACVASPAWAATRVGVQATFLLNGQYLGFEGGRLSATVIDVASAAAASDQFDVFDRPVYPKCLAGQVARDIECECPGLPVLEATPTARTLDLGTRSSVVRVASRYRDRLAEHVMYTDVIRIVVGHLRANLELARTEAPFGDKFEAALARRVVDRLRTGDAAVSAASPVVSTPTPRPEGAASPTPCAAVASTLAARPAAVARPEAAQPSDYLPVSASLPGYELKEALPFDADLPRAGLWLGFTAQRHGARGGMLASFRRTAGPGNLYVSVYDFAGPQDASDVLAEVFRALVCEQPGTLLDVGGPPGTVAVVATGQGPFAYWTDGRHLVEVKYNSYQGDAADAIGVRMGVAATAARRPL